jgi:hypothetical protein
MGRNVLAIDLVTKKLERIHGEISFLFNLNSKERIHGISLPFNLNCKEIHHGFSPIPSYLGIQKPKEIGGAKISPSILWLPN